MKPEMINFFDRYLDDRYTRRLLSDMIRIPSVVGSEQTLAEFILKELQEMGIESRLDEVEPGRSNVYARLSGSRPGKRLHFTGHMDTVPVCEGWIMDPFAATVQGDKMIGLGSCDMKAGLACAMNMLRAIKLSGIDFAGELLFSAVVDEEAYSKGTLKLAGTDFGQCDAVVIAEPFPADEQHPTPIGITGKVLYDITVKGKAAHGFLPHEGINAVEEAARILTALDRLNLRTHPEYGKGNYSTLKIEGGYQIYTVVVPDVCRVEINRLLVPGETSQSALQDMRDLVASLNLSADVDVTLKAPVYESYVLNNDEPILQVLNEIYPLVMGGKIPHYGFSHVITDANVFAGKLHIPTIHLGPPMGNIHQRDEYVLLSWLAPVSKMYALIAERFLS